jgi:chemotaxis protein MotB
LVVVWLSGCAATIELEEHQGKLAAQEAAYEDRIRRTDEDKQRAERDANQRASLAEAKTKAHEERIAELESALADKQRLLDDVGSQLVDLQGAFSKLSSSERAKATAKSAEEKRREGLFAKSKSRFQELLAKEIEQGRIELGMDATGLVITFGDGALFAQGSTRMTKEAEELAKRIAQGLVAEKEPAIRIDIHSDNVVPKNGKFRDSWSLTSQQGTSLVRALQEHGVDPSRLSGRACGQFSPRATNDTKDGRAKNRRIELRLLVNEV